MWKVLNKEVDLGEPTAFLDHVCLGCTQRQCEISKDIVDNYRTMFELRTSAGGTEKLPFPQNRRISSWSYDMAGHRSVWNDIVSWQTRRLSNSTKYLLHASMTTTSKKKKWNLLENCQIHALKLFWNACTWHELDDPMFYGQWISLRDPSQNGPRPVTNAWIDWFHIFITHVNTNNIVMWEILPNNADWDCFKTLTSREILKIRNPLLEEHYVYFRKSHIYSNKLDVQESNCCFSQFNRIWNLRLVACSGIMGSNRLCSCKCFLCFRSIGENWVWCSQTSQFSQENRCDERHWFCSLKCPIRASRSFVACVWGQRSNDQDDHESYNETSFQDPQSFASLIVRSNQLGPKNPNQVHQHKKNKSQACWPREIPHVMSGIICCACSILAISVLQCSETMAKRLQHESGEERVTAKSRQMLSLIARVPSNVSSSFRGAIGTTWYQFSSSGKTSTISSWATKKQSWNCL